MRHGESLWNAQGRLQGQTPDVGLTPLGLAQAEAVAAALADSGAAAVLTSDLLRAQQTAAAVARRLGLSAQPTVALREQALGAHEGRLLGDVASCCRPARPDTDPDRRPGGGESLRMVHARVGELLASLLAEDAGTPVVLVSHGDTIRVATTWLRRLPVEQVTASLPPNGSITTVRVRAGAAVEVSNLVAGP
ncbi:hypothetical protein BH20ACT6_BH20ACT6_18430 [soil metagenome]